MFWINFHSINGVKGFLKVKLQEDTWNVLEFCLFQNVVCIFPSEQTRSERTLCNLLANTLNIIL